MMMQSYQIALPLLGDADVEARQLGHSYIGPEHLLLATATHASGASRAFFDRHGLSAPALRDSVVTLLGHQFNAPSSKEPLRIALRSHMALARAVAAASARRDPALAFTPDELLGALFAEDVAAGGVVGALLESLELTPTSARAELAASGFGEPAT
jgi:ATP-dependent Clp protease ATP-binding subunit ClpA